MTDIQLLRYLTYGAVIAGIFFLGAAAYYSHGARAEMRRLRKAVEWQRTPPDKRIATIALALETLLFTEPETTVAIEGESARQLRLVLRWCQTPVKFAPPGKIAASIESEVATGSIGETNARQSD